MSRVVHIVRYGFSPPPEDAFEALCGAGRPIRFPEGHGYVMVDDPLDGVTCTACLAKMPGQRPGPDVPPLAAFLRRALAVEGCTDGSCSILGPSTGMHTNGGCHCLDDVRPPSLRLQLRQALKAERDGALLDYLKTGSKKAT